MQIAYDPDGKVMLVGSSHLPDSLNDISLTVVELSEEQEAAYKNLGERSGTIFDGKEFVAIPPAPVVDGPPPVTVEALVSALTAKGVLSKQDIDQAATDIRSANVPAQ